MRVILGSSPGYAGTRCHMSPKQITNRPGTGATGSSVPSWHSKHVGMGGLPLVTK